MTIIEKYEYFSNYEIKVARKEDLKTLAEEERKSILTVDLKMYKELLELVQRCTNEWETSEILTDRTGHIVITVSPHFNKLYFRSEISPEWTGMWRFR